MRYIHQMNHTTLFEPWHGLPRGLRKYVSDQCLRQTFGSAYETEAKSYDLTESMPAQY